MESKKRRGPDSGRPWTEAAKRPRGRGRRGSGPTGRPRLRVLCALAGLCISAGLPALAACDGKGSRAPACTVEPGRDAHRISPEIYGLSAAPLPVLTDLNVPLDRWGGNTACRYNWRLGNAWNTGKDWFFENVAVEEDAWRRFLDGCRSSGARAMLTVPLVGYVARDTTSASFSVERYGPQQAADPQRPDAGNGLRPDGGPVTGNDPADASVPCGPDCVGAWARTVLREYPDMVLAGRVIFSLGNEPMLWNIQHRDVHPEPVGYDEILRRFRDTASAVREAAPGILIAGPELWGWPAYFQSAADREAGGSRDRKAHGDIPFLPWFLREMRRNDLHAGHRLIDLVTVHFYPQAAGVYSEDHSEAVRKLRLASTRSLYDPGYKDPSWIADTVRLVPRLREWVRENYPGLGVGVTEYNWGGERDMSGGLALADVLGTFGRERLDLACYWTTPPAGTPARSAYALYRNADGRGAAFGDLSLGVRWTRPPAAPDDLSVYAALDERTSTLTLVAVNRSLQETPLELDLSRYAPGPGDAYLLSAPGTSLERLTTPVPLQGGKAEVRLPARSALHLRFPLGPGTRGSP